METPVAPAEPEAPFVETAYEDLTDDAKRAMEFLSGMIERMGVEGELKACETPEQLRVQLFGENMSILIGRRGETLDALQYLTSLNVNRGREEYLRVSLDTENYRAKREEALRKLAARMANRCRKTGKRVALEPMNPYERRILHSALQARPHRYHPLRGRGALSPRDHHAEVRPPAKTPSLPTAYAAGGGMFYEKILRGASGARAALRSGAGLWAGGETVHGIDVSVYQGSVDFSRVAQSGVRMVYIRSTLGFSYVDPTHERNADGARAAGLEFGFYHFCTASTTDEAVAPGALLRPGPSPATIMGSSRCWSFRPRGP